MGQLGTKIPSASSRAVSPGGSECPSNGAPRTPATLPPAVSVRGLTKSYHAGITGCSARVEALRGIDLDVHPGECLGLLGPPAAGKSTFLLCLAGMLRPDAGSVAWFGRSADVGGRPPGIAYVPHRAVHFAFMTVREVLDYHTMLREIPVDDRQGAVDEALESSGLAAAALAPVSALPRSFAPRLCLAQALVGRPRMLLLDETLSGLDPVTRRELSVVLRALSTSGVTLIIAAPELDVLEPLAHRVAIIVEGRISTVVDAALLRRSRSLELRVATPALARRIFGSRVAEVAWDRHLLRLPLEGTTPEAILARCQSSGIRVETSRVVMTESSATSDQDRNDPWARD